MRNVYWIGIDESEIRFSDLVLCAPPLACEPTQQLEASQGSSLRTDFFVIKLEHSCRFVDFRNHRSLIDTIEFMEVLPKVPKGPVQNPSSSSLLPLVELEMSR